MKAVALAILLFIVACAAPQKQIVVKYKYTIPKGVVETIDSLREELNSCRESLHKKHTDISPRIIYLDMSEAIEEYKEIESQSE